ncbi:hypothetical protein HAX54_045581, partial [Datura stramonium]|nr:hypothetical protein [Datura stramonium]
GSSRVKAKETLGEVTTTHTSCSGHGKIIGARCSEILIAIADPLQQESVHCS